MNNNKVSQSPFAGGQSLLALACVLGPALVALIPMAAAPALPAMAREFSLGSNGQLFAQLVMTAPALMLILFSPLTGLVAAKYGSRSCMIVCLAIYSISGAAVLWVQDAYTLIALRLLLGISGGGILATSLTLIGNHFSGEPRERLLGYATAMASIFAAVALVFGGALVDFLGWRAPFGLYLLGLPVLLAAWRSIKPGLTRADHDPQTHTINHQSLRPAWPYYALLIVLTVGMFTPSIQGPFLLESRDINNATTRGMIIGATSVVAIFSAGFYGKLRHYISAPRVLVINTLCMGAGLSLLACSTNIAAMLAGCSLVGIGAGMSEPSIASIILERTPAYVHGLAMGLIVSALNSGQFLNPLIMNQFRTLLGLDASILALGAILAALAVLIFVKFKNPGSRLSTACNNT
ncbi:MAG: MFS transporter [Gammaproteobacteria bacterium]|nr:MFS transporter [Gammaproteobacteria bacterium]